MPYYDVTMQVKNEDGSTHTRTFYAVQADDVETALLLAKAQLDGYEAVTETAKDSEFAKECLKEYSTRTWNGD